MTLPAGTDAYARRWRLPRRARGRLAALEALLTRVEKRAPRTLSDDELLALPVLYRSTLSSLSVARATSLDQRADRLSRSAVRARLFLRLRRARAGCSERVGGFFLRDWPAAVAACGARPWSSVGLTVVGAVAGLLAGRARPRWFDAIIAPSLAGGRDPDASTAALRSDALRRRQQPMACRSSPPSCSPTTPRSRSWPSRWASPLRVPTACC